MKVISSITSSTLTADRDEHIFVCDTSVESSSACVAVDEEDELLINANKVVGTYSFTIAVISHVWITLYMQNYT